MKELALVITAMLALYGFIYATRASAEDIASCMESSGMTWAQCQVELNR